MRNDVSIVKRGDIKYKAPKKGMWGSHSLLLRKSGEAQDVGESLKSCR